MSDLEKNSGGIPIRPLGRTGVSVSILGLGGGHIGRAAIPQQEAVRLIQSGIDQGISFMDNAWEWILPRSQQVEVTATKSFIGVVH